MVAVLTLTSLPLTASVYAGHNSTQEVVLDQAPVVFEDIITVDKEGGKFKIGFVTLEFKKGFLDNERLPATFKAKVFVQNGEAGIEITPGTNDFNRKVLIKVSRYKGLLYDGSLGSNVNVDIKNQTILAEHFSWYRFR
jgi:hypothetical protein